MKSSRSNSIKNFLLYLLVSLLTIVANGVLFYYRTQQIVYRKVIEFLEFLVTRPDITLGILLAAFFVCSTATYVLYVSR